MIDSINNNYSLSTISNVSNINNTDNNTNTNVNTDLETNNIEYYEEQVDAETNLKLSSNGVNPDNDAIYLWDTKTYKEDNFLCLKRNKLFGGYKVIKEETSGITDLLMNLMTNKRPEKIIEDYNKDNKLTKKTYYKADGSCIVTKYNTDGSISVEANISKKNKTDSSCEQKMEITQYYNNGNYSVEKTNISMDDTCTDGKPIISTSVTNYNKDGNVDIANSIISNILISLFQ